ncbi:hypothetical protein [Mucilaginibacter sp. BT774]|uniref:hypothetical protein n=1 Tax=Mucilaginibacter sp. BT774 TaxID=3062276 RepID=UPI002674875D|nr:hypothetical protein [Mucilaginibacter sp. BT774]MDO3626559.1 hypothetical protein [Mucilaginibacter sp. BT774]
MYFTNKRLLIFAGVFIALSGCAMFQSAVKSSFPYTSTLVVPASSKPGSIGSAISTATSFDQNFGKNNADRIKMVRIVSARLMSTEPSDYNLGNLSEVRIYLSNHEGQDEVMVASRSDIGANVGNDVVLDIDNSNMLDELVREPQIRVRMTYKVRNASKTDASVHVVLGLAAYPAPK